MQVPVVDKYVGAFNVPMEEVQVVAIFKRQKELLQERRNLELCEVDQVRLQETVQVVVDVFEDEEECA